MPAREWPSYPFRDLPGNLILDSRVILSQNFLCFRDCTPYASILTNISMPAMLESTCELVINKNGQLMFCYSHAISQKFTMPIYQRQSSIYFPDHGTYHCWHPRLNSIMRPNAPENMPSFCIAGCELCSYHELRGAVAEAAAMMIRHFRNTEDYSKVMFLRTPLLYGDDKDIVLVIGPDNPAIREFLASVEHTQNLPMNEWKVLLHYTTDNYVVLR